MKKVACIFLVSNLTLPLSPNALHAAHETGISKKKDEPVVFNPMVISATLSDKSIEEIPGTLHLFDKEKSGCATYAVPVTSCRKHQASISGEQVRAARRLRQIAATVFRSAESQASQEHWFCWTTRK